jgi:hypothetical protein
MEAAGISNMEMPAAYIHDLIPLKIRIFWVMTKLDALFLNVFIYASICFEQQVLIIRRAKLY